MALGKGLGGGVVPIGACVGTPRTWERYIENPFLHTTTFGGNPVCCAAAIATIDAVLSEDLPRQAAQKGDYLLSTIGALARKYPKALATVRGRGLMLGMEFSGHEVGYAVAKNLFARRILISGTYINARCLRVEPSLTIARAELDKFLQALEESLQAVSKEFKL